MQMNGPCTKLRANILSNLLNNLEQWFSLLRKVVSSEKIFLFYLVPKIPTAFFFYLLSEHKRKVDIAVWFIESNRTIYSTHFARLFRPSDHQISPPVVNWHSNFSTGHQLRPFTLLTAPLINARGLITKARWSRRVDLKSR